MVCVHERWACWDTVCKVNGLILTLERRKKANHICINEAEDRHEGVIEIHVKCAI
jgi:hypothetical protein